MGSQDTSNKMVWSIVEVLYLPLCWTVLWVWRRHVWPRWWPTSWSACLHSCCLSLCSGSPNPSSTASSSTSQPLRLMGTRWWTAWPCCLRNRWAGRTLWCDWLVCLLQKIVCLFVSLRLSRLSIRLHMVAAPNGSSGRKFGIHIFRGQRKFRGKFMATFPPP